MKIFIKASQNLINLIKRPFLYLFLVFTLVSFFAQAQSDTRFWFAAPDITSGHGFEPIRIVVSAFDVPAIVTVTQPANLAFPTYVVNVAANSSQSINLTPSLGLVETPYDTPGLPIDVSRTGLLVESTAKITAYYEVNAGNNPDIFALKGKNALGKDFYVPFQNLWRHAVKVPNGRSGFIIVATEDNTSVTVTPTRNLEGGQMANIPFTFNLNKGQTYVGSVIEAPVNGFPAGSRIQADKDVAVTKFSDSIYSGENGCNDLAGDQLVPVRILGTEYVVLRGQLGIGNTTAATNPELVVVLATQNGTSVEINGTIVDANGAAAGTTLNAGETYTHKLTIDKEKIFVKTGFPAYVGHYAGYGCETGFAILPPVNCTGSLTTRITRSTTDNFTINLMTRGTPIGGDFDFTNNFTIKVTTSTGITTTLFDTNPATLIPSFPPSPIVFTQIGTSDYYGVQYTFGTEVAAGSVVTVESTTVTPGTNEAGLFHLGFVNGSAGGGTRYGYFSDFRALDLGDDVNINYGTNTRVKADIQATNFRWLSDGVQVKNGPDNFYDVIDIQRRQTIRVEATVGDCIINDEICVGTLEYVWDGRGADPANINDPANWSTPCGISGIPNCGVDIIIPPTPVASSLLRIRNGDILDVRNITILNGGTLEVANGGQVNVCGSMVHDGRLNMLPNAIGLLNSTFSFVGVGRQNYSKAATGTGDFENLVIASNPIATNVSTFNSIIGVTLLASSAQDLSISNTGTLKFEKGYILPEAFPATTGIDNSKSVVVKNPAPNAITGFAGAVSPGTNTKANEYFVAGKLNRAKNASDTYSFPVGLITQPPSEIQPESNKNGAMISNQFANADWLNNVTYGSAVCNPNPNGALRLNTLASGSGASAIPLTTNKYINFGANTSSMAVGASDARTVEIWAKVTQFNGAGLFQFGSSTVPNGDFALVTLDRAGFTPNSDNNWGVRLGNGFTLDVINLNTSLNNWNHYALTYNGDNVNPQVAFYYNGVLIRNYPLRDALNNPVPLTTSLTNGFVGKWSGNANNLKGEVDELRVWSEARTATQIKASFDQGCASNALQCPQANNLKAYYNFEDSKAPNTNATRTIQSRTITCPLPIFSYQRADVVFNSVSSVDNVTASFKKYDPIPTMSTGQTNICNGDFNSLPPLDNGFWNFSSFNGAATTTPNGNYYMYLYNRDYGNYAGASTTVMTTQTPYAGSPGWNIPSGFCEANTPQFTGRSGFGGNMGFFGTAQSTDNTVLPVELISISATPEENAILVEWATLQELDNYGFEVFRAEEEGDFVKIGLVKAKGNSTTRQDYNLLDVEVKPNVNYYYKLKQIDTNGKFNFTKTVTAKLSDSDFTGEQINTIYPNPTDNEFTLYLGGKEFKKATQVKITLINAIGEELETRTVNTQSGNRINFKLIRYPKGIYLLRIVSETSSTVMKVVKE